MPSSETDQTIDDLLLRWEEGYQEGEELTPEVLCAEHPELLREVVEGIHALKETQSLFEAAENPTVSVPIVDGGTPGVEMNVEELIASIVANGLCNKDTLRQILEDLTDPTNSRSLGKALVRNELLTEFQADVLMHRKPIPLRLGDYVIRSLIGVGGMGAVYKAWHQRLDRLVAAKLVIPERHQSEDSLRRFEREIRALTRLEHTNIVTAYDAGQVDSVLYLIMQLVDGVDVSRLNRRISRFKVCDACEVTAQAAAGLMFAHENGLIHRDIKPSNLMVTRDGTVKVMDLGLARGDSLNEEQEITASGKLIGTIDYMSPEQGTNSHDANERSDIYSLGATLYRMLSGKSPLGDSHGTLGKAAALVRDEATPLQRLRPDIPPRLAGYIARMMSKDPRQRPESMRDVMEVMAQYSDGSQLSDMVQGGREFAETYAADLHHPRRPSKLIATGLAGLIGAVVIAGIIITIKNPDGTETKLKIDNGSEVEIDLSQQSPRVTVIPETVPSSSTNALELAVAKRILSIRGEVVVRFGDDAGTVTLTSEGPFPSKAFRLEGLIMRQVAGALTDDDLEQISKLKHLTSVNIYDSGLTDERFGMIAKLPTLEAIHGGFNGLTAEGVVMLENHPTLNHLNLWGGRLIDASVALPSLSTIPNLSVINVGYWNITDDDLPHLAKLPKLESLWLEGNKRLTSQGFSALQNMKGLKKLALGGTAFDDSAAQYLAGLAQLEFLQLKNTSVTEKTVALISNLPKLGAISLPPSASSDDSLRLLQSCKSLIQLSLKDSNLSAEALDEFRKAMPQCLVTGRKRSR